MDPYFDSRYLHEVSEDKPVCIVDAGGATGGTATVDYQYNEIHYHIDIHFPENIDAEGLKQVLEALRHPEKLPEEIDTPIIKKRKGKMDFFRHRN